LFSRRAAEFAEEEQVRTSFSVVMILQRLRVSA